MNPIEYLIKQGFSISSNPHKYASGIFGLRNYTVNGYNYDSFCGGMHAAWDLFKPDGSAIPSVAEGIIVAGTTAYGNFGGQTVVAYPQLGIQAIYGHLKRNIPVKIGQKVKQGQTIGYQGNTNYNNVRMDSHLHIQFQPLGYIADERTFVCTGIDVSNIDVNKKISAPVPAVENDKVMIIDVSEYQSPESINYDTLSKHVDLVIVRVMDADYRDKVFETHIKEFQKCGVPVAVYAFVRGQNDTHMVNEAKMFYDRAAAFDPTFWFLDVETITKQGYNMRKGVSVYLNELRRLGAKKVGLYIAHHLYKQLNLDVDEADAVWIPHYGSGSTTPDSKPEYPADIHQYTEYGSLPGYNGNLDLNRLIGDKPIEFFTDGQESKIKPSVPVAESAGGDVAADNTTTYKVRSGDTLSGIAQLFSTTTAKLQSLNAIQNANQIYVGQVLKVTGGVAGGGSTSAYTVQPGDTLSGIAQMYNTTVAALQSENSIKNANNIQVGAVLRIPGGGTSTSYTVQAGDTLSHIAARYNTTVSALQKLNGITNKDVIYAGQILKVKGATGQKKTTQKHHVVKSGDTVSGLAVKYGSTQKQIVNWNKLASADKIYVGQKLRVK